MNTNMRLFFYIHLMNYISYGTFVHLLCYVHYYVTVNKHNVMAMLIPHNINMKT